MSLSASDNTSSFSRIPSGKTPPPAPSAAFHKRLVSPPLILRLIAEPTLMTTQCEGDGGRGTDDWS